MPPRTTALTPEQARALGKAALANAVSLLDEVKILLEHHKWARSYALATLAIEEYGKFRLCEEAAARPPANWRNFWSELKTHDPKTREWSGALLDSMRPPRGGGQAAWNHARSVMTADNSKFAKAVSESKMSGLYVDWDDPSAQPLIPGERVNEALARNMFNAASRVIH
ncbi:abortive infection protein, AbiV family [Amycolatopsis pretoriensis]|uniref:Abortive infection protein, AbiV family n=1 Tax=Amycolatopsis pretoriensis TaxID=218821 RepID=A0A1H5QNJ8_9PSEU|nr:AbiV family abortive infection protein [Amycolatopsis pretoriensis]SEF27656.1 abortive infection protein, AbiV family [Amycolatopsis pretoriensis]